MIVCRNCGKVDYYEKRYIQKIKQMASEYGGIIDTKIDEAKQVDGFFCPKCGRQVKFFKDYEDDNIDIFNNEMECEWG